MVFSVLRVGQLLAQSNFGTFLSLQEGVGAHGQRFPKYSLDVSHTWNQTIRGIKFSSFIHVVASITPSLTFYC